MKFYDDENGLEFVYCADLTEELAFIDAYRNWRNIETGVAMGTKESSDAYNKVRDAWNKLIKKEKQWV